MRQLLERTIPISTLDGLPTADAPERGRYRPIPHGLPRVQAGLPQEDGSAYLTAYRCWPGQQRGRIPSPSPRPQRGRGFSRAASFPECIVLKSMRALTAKAEDFVANAPDKTKLQAKPGDQSELCRGRSHGESALLCLIDFQVYLRNDGAVLNIDLDRCDELIPRTRGRPLNDSQKLELAHVSSQVSAKRPLWPTRSG